MRKSGTPAPFNAGDVQLQPIGLVPNPNYGAINSPNTQVTPPSRGESRAKGFPTSEPTSEQSQLIPNSVSIDELIERRLSRHGSLSSVSSFMSRTLSLAVAEQDQPSLSEAFMTVKMTGSEEEHGGFRLALKQLWQFCGVGLMVAVGYMDPGNWATDLEAGAKYGYVLMFSVLISSIMATVLQYLALKLGVAAGKDLAQACRAKYGRKTNIFLWITAEIAIAACDVAEVIGSAIALELLFGLPLIIGVVLTSLDVLLILFIEQQSFRHLEFVVGSLIVVISTCFAYELYLSQPQWVAVAKGLMPTASLVTDRKQLLLAVGILGATVMPHNLYLHSAIVQTRSYVRSTKGKRRAIMIAAIDSTVALAFAFFVNGAILILSSSTFHGTAHQDVTEISDAFKLLSPTLGVAGASTVFAIALLGSGQNSTITGTLAGQIVMEGFVSIKLKPWARRLLTRCLAIIPAAIISVGFGSHGVGQLLLFSQVILSLQLSFAVIPLVMFTSDPQVVGPEFVNCRQLVWLSVLIAVVIVGLNLFLVYQTILDAMHGNVAGF